MAVNRQKILCPYGAFLSLRGKTPALSSIPNRIDEKYQEQKIKQKML